MFTLDQVVPWGRSFSEDFHVTAIQEMCRVAEEVRVFPLLALGGNPSRHDPSGEMVPLSRFLEGIRAGHYSYTRNVPAPVLAECLPQLESWAATYFDLGPVPMPREIVWKIYRKPTDSQR